MFHRVLILILLCCNLFLLDAQVADQKNYLQGIGLELQKKWPENRTVNFVFHGNSVPSGYFNTPNVVTLQAYPHLVFQALKESYATAVINSITTSIGGENAEQGAKRFRKEVLVHRPDVLFIDYALNDRGIGLERAKKAWELMIIAAKKESVKIILLTPTPDLTEDILNDDSPLEHHSRQIRRLAEEYCIGLVDSYEAFKKIARNGENLRNYMSQSNHPNSKGHEVVAELIMEYLLDESRAKVSQANKIRKVMERVADWQLIHFENQVQKGSRWPNSHAYWAWTNATMYVGMAELAKLTGDSKYWNFLLTTGGKNKWKTGPSIYFADDLCIIQSYCQLYKKFEDEEMIHSSLDVLNRIIGSPSTASLSYHAPNSHSRWCWCDAHFMAPTSFARIGKITGDIKYFDFLDKEFWVTYDTLYCHGEKLFFRDTRYIAMREENGEKVFWGRGNGWVIGALTIIIDNLPEDYPTRNRYISLYREMMERIVPLQDAQGFWHPSMLDYTAYPMPETSASGFFIYGLLWGINRNILDKNRYYPIAEKGWKALCSVVHHDGKLGYVQVIGADPKKVNFDDTEVYGVGAFLLAGTEMYKCLKEDK